MKTWDVLKAGQQISNFVRTTEQVINREAMQYAQETCVQCKKVQDVQFICIQETCW